MKLPVVHNFSGVDVCIPQKVTGSEAEEEWQEVNWVTWSTGDLSVDNETYMITFKPYGNGSGALKAKVLGAMVRASDVQPEGGGRTLVVTTSDALHRSYRLTLQDVEQTQELYRLAQLAEAAREVAPHYDRSDGERIASEKRDAASKFANKIGEVLSASVPPLIYVGAQLCGVDPHGERGSEVLLGNGVFVLLDTPGKGTIGTYEMMFYSEDDGEQKPVKRFTIGPKSALRRLPQEKADQNNCSLSDSEDGPAANFELVVGPLPSDKYELSFDTASAADAFSRDFNIRQRLMDVCLKTAKRGQTASDLRNELEGLKQQTLSAQLWRLFCCILIGVCIAAIVRLAVLYKTDGGASPSMIYIKSVAHEAFEIASISRTIISDVGGKVCEYTIGAVPASHLRYCLNQIAVKRCVAELVGVMTQADF